jgi:hypothetical protein
MKQILITLLLFTSLFLQAQLPVGGNLYVFPLKYNDQTEEFEMQSSSIIISIQRKTAEIVKRDLMIDLTIDNIIYETVAGLKTTFYECSTPSGGYILLSISRESEDSYILSVTYEENNTIVYRGNKWR